MKKAVVLLSGGLDSATTLAIARHEGFECYALSFAYGQRHAIELEAAARLAQALGAAGHRVAHIDLRIFGGSALTADIAVPKHRGNTEIGTGIPITYVPARNTIFLSFALAWAEVLGAADIFLGVNALDYSGYPDCRPEFYDAVTETIRLGSKVGTAYNVPIRIEAPIITMSKADIVRYGTELGAPLELTWSCYAGGDTPCGACDSCELRAAGFAAAGIPDPALAAR